MADSLYEGSDPVKAFATKPQAEAFALRCRAYAMARPECPEIIADTPENDAEWKKYMKRQHRWQRRHPAGEDSATCNDFSVMPIDLQEPTDFDGVVEDSAS